ncbi:MAG: hypothetical protein J6R67_04860 [Treponema sp.]|nr:hypothetical protein [Treponema sp.]
MKLSFGRIAVFFLTSFFCSSLWCQPVELYGQEYLEGGVGQDFFEASTDGVSPSLPPLLAGLWQNSQRIVSFENLDSASVILKLFYGWYYDRAAEPGAQTLVESTMSTTQLDYNYSGASQQDFIDRNSVTITDEVLQYDSLPPRPKNDATSPRAQQLLVEFESLIPETETSGAWNIWITYPDIKERHAIPVAVFDGKLYVNFYLGSNDTVSRFFQAASNTNGITISTPLLDKEVTSYLVTGSRMYKIRYWQTDMEYDGETEAVLSGEDGNYQVPKHLLIGGTVYTCVAGRRVDIRNVEEIPLDISGFTMSSDNRIIVQKSAYLSLMDNNASELYQLIAEANSRRAPPPPLPIPLGDLDFHYAEIEDLRKYMIPQPEFPEFEDWDYIKTATNQSF